GGGDAVDDGVDAELLEVDPAFLVDRGVAVEAGGDLLLQGRAGAEVAGDLVDRELVEGHVAVQGVDDPVAVLPDRARGVDAVPVGVGVAGEGQATSAPSTSRQ